MGIDFMVLLHYLQILKMLYLGLYYLGNLHKIFMTRSGFEDFKNIVDICLLQHFMKLLRSEHCILNTLTCEVLMWFCIRSMILVIASSLWRCLCDDPIYVTTRLCDDPSVWQPSLWDDLVCVTTLSYGLGWDLWF